MKYFAAFLLFSVALLTGCGKDELSAIKRNKAQKQYQLVVEGGINTFQKAQYIRLSEPVSDIDSVPKPARGALVSVNDGERNSVFKETATPGVYSGTVISNTNYNKAYTLLITYNNKEYKAVDTLRQVVNIIDDFLPMSCKLSNAKVDITIPKHTFGFLNSCKWLIAYPGTPLWSPARFDAAIYYNYTHTQGSPNSIYPLINLNRQAVVAPADPVTIYKFSMSETYSDYLYAVFQETDWKGIFSTVPGEIKGNLSEGAVGFFYVIDVDIRRYRASDLVN